MDALLGLLAHLIKLLLIYSLILAAWAVFVLEGWCFGALLLKYLRILHQIGHCALPFHNWTLRGQHRQLPLCINSTGRWLLLRTRLVQGILPRLLLALLRRIRGEVLLRAIPPLIMLVLIQSLLMHHFPVQLAPNIMSQHILMPPIELLFRRLCHRILLL